MGGGWGRWGLEGEGGGGCVGHLELGEGLGALDCGRGACGGPRGALHAACDLAVPLREGRLGGAVGAIRWLLDAQVVQGRLEGFLQLLGVLGVGDGRDGLMEASEGRAKGRGQGERRSMTAFDDCKGSERGL